MPSGPATLDPWAARDAASLLAQRQIYETLVTVDGGRVAPALATAWTVSADGLEWRFTLRTDVVFQDGTPFDARAVVENVRRMERSPGPYDLAAIVDAVDAVDAGTVVLRLRARYAPLLATLAAPPLAMASPGCVERDARWATLESACPAGTGPFQILLGGARGAASLPLVANGRYWRRDGGGARLPYLDGVTLLRLSDASERLAAVRGGGAEVTVGLGAAELAAARADPNLSLAERPPSGVVWLGVSADGPLSSAAARRALAMAVDRDAIVRAAFAGQAEPAAQLLPPDVPGYDDTVAEFAPSDATAARTVLASAGGAGLALDLAYDDAPSPAVRDPARLAAAVAAQLGRIDLAVTPRALSSADLAAGAAAGRLPLWVDARAPLRRDAVDLVDSWGDPVAAELLRTAAATAEAQRAELYKQVSKMLQQQVTRIPLVYTTQALVWSGRLRGLVPGVLGEAYGTVWIGR